jgi:predicted RNase H-like HicB family nuclease
MEDEVNRYAVVIERAEANLSAYVPDLPGCVATGRTEGEVRANIAEAIRLHIESLRDHGEPVPPPSATTAAVDVA